MTQVIAPETTVGVVALTVSNLARTLEFYQGLGFAVLHQEGGQAVLGVGEKPLIHFAEMPGARQVQKVTGLYHLAVRLPSRAALARLIYELAEHEIEVQGASDHGVSEAFYLADPDGIGIELYADRHPREWPRDDLGRLQMGTEELDIDDLLMELADGLTDWAGLPAGTSVGHVHLHVANLAETERFYTQVLGFALMQRYGAGALFFSAGGYHHHVGANIWAGVGAPPPPADAAGLRWFELLLPTVEALNAVLDRARAAGIAFEELPEGVQLRDPAQNAIRLRVA